MCCDFVHRENDGGWNSVVVWVQTSMISVVQNSTNTKADGLEMADFKTTKMTES